MTEECLVGATELREGIFVASTLVKPCLPVLILNINEHEVQLNEISPNLYKISEYHICTFDTCDKSSSSRVKKLCDLIQLKHLNREELKTIENICSKYSDIFLLPGDKLTTTDVYKHRITVKPNVDPVYNKPYRLPYSQKTELNNQLSNLLKDGIIEPCKSEWSSPILLVPKKKR